MPHPRSQCAAEKPAWKAAPPSPGPSPSGQEGFSNCAAPGRKISPSSKPR